MKFTCDKNLFSSAIDGASRAVTSRSTIPVLEGVLLKAEGFSLTVTGYDKEIGITTTIEANVLKAGDTVINARQLGDIMHRMPAGTVEIEINEKGLAHIQNGFTEFDIPTFQAADYPELPNPGADPTISVSCKELSDIISKTIYAVSNDEKNPAHTGELFVFEQGELTVVALDGYRLAIVKRQLKCERELRIIIPAKTMQETLKLIGNSEDEQVAVSANRRYVVFSTNQYTIISRLIEGEFLDYKRVLPEKHATRVTVETKPFIESLERSSLVIAERIRNPLRITFDPAVGRITTRCQSAMGRVQDELSASMEGETTEIGFNSAYLLDALRNAKQEEVLMEINGPISPIKILPKEGEDFIYLVLPVRFKND